jgi:hypothetical protein
MFVTNIVLEVVMAARQHHGGGDNGDNNVRDGDVMVIAKSGGVIGCHKGYNVSYGSNNIVMMVAEMTK